MTTHRFEISHGSSPAFPFFSSAATAKIALAEYVSEVGASVTHASGDCVSLVTCQASAGHDIHMQHLALNSKPMLSRSVWIGEQVRALSAESGEPQSSIRLSFCWDSRWVSEHVKPMLRSGAPLTPAALRALDEFYGSRQAVERLLRVERPASSDWNDLLPHTTSQATAS